MQAPSEKSSNVGHLAQVLTALLSKPPAQAGMRLRSQRALSVQLGIDRHAIRRAFDALEKDGMIVQRQGSGSFLRRIPPVQKDIETLGLTTEDLLDGIPQPSRRALEPRRGALRLGMLQDCHWPVPTRQRVREELQRQAIELGHALDVLSVTSAPGVYLDSEPLRHMLSEDHDAFLVHADAAEMLLPWLSRGARPYVVFDALDVARHSPTVLSNLDEAVERAIETLAEAGWHSIGLLSYRGSVNLDLEQFRHTRALARFGLEGRGLAVSVDLSPEGIERGMSLMLSAGADAVYIADDNLFSVASRTLLRAGRRPGQDFGVITMAVHGMALGRRHAWSRMVFDPAEFARRTLQVLLAALQRADSPPGHLACLLQWCPGNTHRHPPASPSRRL